MFHCKSVSSTSGVLSGSKGNMPMWRSTQYNGTCKTVCVGCRKFALTLCVVWREFVGFPGFAIYSKYIAACRRNQLCEVWVQVKLLFVQIYASVSSAPTCQFDLQVVLFAWSSQIFQCKVRVLHYRSREQQNDPTPLTLQWIQGPWAISCEAMEGVFAWSHFTVLEGTNPSRH